MSDIDAVVADADGVTPVARDGQYLAVPNAGSDARSLHLVDYAGESISTLCRLPVFEEHYDVENSVWLDETGLTQRFIYRDGERVGKLCANCANSALSG